MFDFEGSRSANEVEAGALQAESASVTVPSTSNGSGQLAYRLRADRARHLRYLRSRLPSMEDAEDALQDTTLKLLNHEDLFSGTDNPEGWIAVALRNTVIDHYRRAAARRRLSASLSMEPPQSPEGESEAEFLPSPCLKATLSALKAEYASLLTQVYLLDTSLRDVAKNQKLTTNNVGVMLHRARKALRSELQTRCRTCHLHECCARQTTLTD